MEETTQDRWLSEAGILATVEAFESNALPRAADHAAHLAVGLVYVRRYGAEGALPPLRQRIQAYNRARGRTAGEQAGYREDITRHYVDAIAALVSESEEDDLGGPATRRSPFVAVGGVRTWLRWIFQRRSRAGLV